MLLLALFGRVFPDKILNVTRRSKALVMMMVCMVVCVEGAVIANVEDI